MKSEWFETFFQGAFVELWTRVMPPALTLADADFLEKTLAPGAPAHLLDIACGNGRHAIELARRGHTMTGVDLSSDFLEAARKASAAAGVAIEWQRGDMRALALPDAAFDGAYCFGNTFCYLNRANAEVCLKAVARALRPGAKLVIDIGTAAESILPALLPKRWHRAGDIFMLSECRYVAEASRLDIDYTILQGGHVETHPTCSYVMTAAALKEMIEQTGFAAVTLHGGVAGEPFQLSSPRLVITAAAA